MRPATGKGPPATPQDEGSHMALTRKRLEELGLDSETAEQVIKDHVTTVNGVKNDLDALQKKADGLEKQLEETSKQLEEAQKAAAGDQTGAKLKAVQDEFAAYKADVEKRESAATAERLLREQLKAAKLDERYADLAVKDMNPSQYAVKDGAFEDAEAVGKAVAAFAEKYPQFVTTTATTGANVAHPPATGDGALTKEQFAKMTLRERNDLYVSDRATYDAMVGKN